MKKYHLYSALYIPFDNIFWEYLTGLPIINVTASEPGENIKIYIVSGVEVKSVVANDDVVNIMRRIKYIL